MSTVPEQLELDLGDSASDLLKHVVNGALGGTSQIVTTSVTIPISNYSIGPKIQWNQTYSIIDSAVSNTVVLSEKGIEVKEGGDIKVSGKSLFEVIEKIEERLGILYPNPELETRWEQLKELRKQYQELEKYLLEKEKMWTILKESP
jgi:hypothetical protein